MLRAGDHVVAGDDLYGGTYRIFERVMNQMGLEFTYVDPTSATAFGEAMRPKTKLVWVETPTNPLLKLCDIAAVADLCQKRKVWLAVDNTFLTPALQRPLELGATMVVHSTTKYLNGHADVVGGAVVTRDDEVRERLSFLQNAIGAVPSPMDCFLVLRGTKTLHVRMERHVENARKVAAWLEAHPAVEKVIYPGLASHPQHALARRQMRGPGGMITFVIKDGQEARARARARDAALDPALRLRRVAGRRRVAHRAPGDHDPRVDPAGQPAEARHHRRARAHLGRHRACRRLDWRSAAGAGACRFVTVDAPGV